MKGMRGQTLVLVALALVVLFGMAALALDGGNVYLQRRQMQTAADAAALAAARALCLDPTADWVQVGNDLCLANGADPLGRDDDGDGVGDHPDNPCDVGPGDSDRSAQATAPKAVDTWLASIVGPGLDRIDVAAGAESVCRNVGAAENLLPLAVKVPDGGWAYDDDMELRLNSDWELYDKEDTQFFKDCCLCSKPAVGCQTCDPDTDPDCPEQCDDKKGSYGVIVWADNIGTCPAGTNCTDPKKRVENPCCAGIVYIGQQLTVDPGAMASILKSLEGLCYDPSEDNTVLVPLYESRTPELCEPGAGGTNQTYTVVGFGRFQLTGICGPTVGKSNACLYGGPLTCDSAEMRVTGTFVEYVSGDLIPSDDAPDTGVYVVTLSR